MDIDSFGQQFALWMKSLTKPEQIHIDDAPEDIKERDLGMTGISNARELGGYVMADGRKIKKNYLLRTANLSTASEEDLRRLAEEYKVKLIIDLRSEDEYKRIPDKPVKGANHIWINLMGSSMNNSIGELIQSPQFQKSVSENPDPELFTVYFCKEEKFQKGMKDLYISMLLNEESQERLREIFQNILALQGQPILWHCAQGKDRCGMVAILLMGALGAGFNLMLDDFEISNYYYKETLDRNLYLAAQNHCDQDAMEAVKSIVGVNSEAMKRAIDFMRVNYGSVSNYIRDELGITIKELEMLRDWYLE